MSNKINISTEEYHPQLGDLLKSKYGDVYILSSCEINSTIIYISVNLSTGTIWTNPSHNILDAINGLTFFKRNAQIEIK